MKKLTILCSLFFACHIPAHAQNPTPNWSFETWEVIAPDWEDPQFWRSTNYLTSSFQAPNVRKDSNNAHSGSIAARLTTIGHNNQQVLGAMCTGTLIYPNSCKGGFSVNSSYAGFQGYYKYAPGIGDSCLLFAMLSKWNDANSKRDTIAVATFYGDSAESYQLFYASFNYYSEETPDSAQIIIATSKNSVAPPGGSILVVDDIALSGTVGIKDITSVPVKIFPNPSNEFLELQIPSSLHGSDMEMFDCLGRKMKHVQLINSEETISTEQFPEGIFFYKIHNVEGRLMASGKFIVKH